MGMKDKANQMKDKAMEKAKGVLSDENVDKMAQKADKATGGKRSDQINKAADKAKNQNNNPSQ